MAIPAAAQAFSQPMDPSDLVEWIRSITQGGNDTDFLETGETITGFTLSLSTEAAALGVTIKQDTGYAPTLTGLTLKFWLEVSAIMRSSAIFDPPGVNAAIEFTATTNNNPPRRKQRTMVVKVINL